MVLEFLDVYHKIRKRRMNTQEDTSFRKKPKISSKCDESFESSNKNMKKNKAKAQAMKLAAEVSKLKLSYEKKTKKPYSYEEPYFLPRNSLRRKLSSSEISKVPATKSEPPAANEADVIDVLVENFRDNFNSPRSRSPDDLNRNNYVKRLVAAFEEKYGKQNATPVVTPKSKSAALTSSQNSCNNCLSNSSSKPAAMKSATIRRSPRIHRPATKENVAPMDCLIGNDSQNTSKFNGSLNSSLDTVITDAERERISSCIERCYSDMTFQGRQQAGLELRQTRSCLDKPKIIGAFLKKPIKIENTEVKWIPLSGQKLPRKRSLKKLISKLVRRRKSVMKVDFTVPNSPTDNHDSGIDEKMDAGAPTCFATSSRSLKRKCLSKSSITQPSKRAKEFCTFPGPTTKLLEKTIYSRSKNTVENNNNYIESEGVAKSTTRVILHEVPRENLTTCLSSSYLKILHNSNSGDHLNASKNEMVTVVNKPENVVSRSPLSEANLNSSRTSTFKQSPRWSPNFLSSPRQKFNFTIKRPRSEVLDNSGSSYQRFEIIDSDVDRLVCKSISEPTCSIDIVNNFDKMRLYSEHTADEEDVGYSKRINTARPRSAILSTEIYSSPNSSTYENYAMKVKNCYLNSKFEINNNVSSENHFDAGMRTQNVHDDVASAEVRRRSTRVPENDMETQVKRTSAFFDERMKTANFDIFVSPTARSCSTTGGIQPSSDRASRKYLPMSAMSVDPCSRRSPFTPRSLSANFDNRSHLHTYQLKCQICPNEQCVMRS